MTQIRLAQATDAKGLHDAQIKSIREISSRDLEAQEIALWSAQPYREDLRLKAIRENNVWVIDQDGVIEGYGYLEFRTNESPRIAHLNGPFLTGRAAQQGLAAKIIEKVLSEAKERDVAEIRIDATIGSRRFYLKHGFTDAGPPRSIQAFSIEITRYPMRLVLG